MKVPSTLSQWSLDVVKALLHKGVFESDAFDFKESLPCSKDEEGKRRLRKTIKKKRERCLIVDKPDEFLSRSSGQSREEVEKRVKGLSIQRRMIDPDEVAALALFLVSDKGKGIRGQAINIDGGQVMH